jgi:hypothetical protein
MLSSIGAVLEKQRISSLIASVVLKPFGNKPENVLLGIMSLGMFLSVRSRVCPKRGVAQTLELTQFFAVCM